ncbi:activating transcription factor 4b [Chanos chanos]|uniref:Cyclic AMP-dependent transcription factor ATF-4 n=1 Tax=Chanos chanos TaxID=29144 RepID=A0A6J2WYF7_CHACN|nr:cyclic AMP-dependent transcription factor ATF-4-like [Chanos chanos]
MALMTSLFGLVDMEPLGLASTLLMADPLGGELFQNEEGLPQEGVKLPLSTLSSPLSSLSPPSSPLSTGRGERLDDDAQSFPWLPDDLCPAGSSTDGIEDDAFAGMDWMTERIDLSEFDLDSIIGSEDPDSSPEELIASLESHMRSVSPNNAILMSDHSPTFPQVSVSSQNAGPVSPQNSTSLSNFPNDTGPVSPQNSTSLSNSLQSPPSHSEALVVSPGWGSFSEPVPTYVLSTPSPLVPEPQTELEIKSEPASPVPSPSLLPPDSPTQTLSLGSEVDVSESDKPVSGDVQLPRVVLTLSPTRILVLLPPKQECVPKQPAVNTQTAAGQSAGPVDSSCSEPRRSQSQSKTNATAGSRRAAASPSLSGRVKCVGGGVKVVVEKKLKKMEQNKTAATRYRQKKRAERESLLDECSVLEQRNRELTEKADSIAKEIQYLQELMAEVQRARGRRDQNSV